MWNDLAELEDRTEMQDQHRFYSSSLEIRETSLSRLWTNEISMDEHFHHLQGSPSDFINAFGLIGTASMFSMSVVIYSQSEVNSEFKMTTSVTDGTRHKVDSKMWKVEMDGTVKVKEKDFPGVIEVHQQEGHFLYIKRTGACPEEKRVPWHVFPGWSNDPKLVTQKKM